MPGGVTLRGCPCGGNNDRLRGRGWGRVSSPGTAHGPSLDAAREARLRVLSESTMMKILGPGAGLVDRARDRLSGRGQ